jgi:hypothetical protein
MINKKTTQIPNIVLDQYLKILSPSGLKILLVILRQTNGWVDKLEAGKPAIASPTGNLWLKQAILGGF